MTEAQADEIARQAGATHKDHLFPGMYWKQLAHGTEWAMYKEGKPLEWKASHHTYVPEWCGVI